jgi:hypothetical protein
MLWSAMIGSVGWGLLNSSTEMGAGVTHPLKYILPIGGHAISVSGVIVVQGIFQHALLFTIF